MPKTLRKMQPGYVHPNKGRKRKPEHVAKALAARMANAPSAVERFWAKVDKSGGEDACWPWTAVVDLNGYPQFGSHGNVCVRAARWMMENIMGHDMGKYVRKGARGKVVDHICKNRRCMNPKHLRVVTQLENITVFHPNRERTACTRGHVYTEGSYYARKTGGRICRECQRLYVLADKMAEQLGMEPRPEYLESRKAA